MSEHTDELARTRSRMVDAIEALAALNRGPSPKWGELMSGIDLVREDFVRAFNFLGEALEFNVLEQYNPPKVDTDGKS